MLFFFLGIEMISFRLLIFIYYRNSRIIHCLRTCCINNNNNNIYLKSSIQTSSIDYYYALYRTLLRISLSSNLLCMQCSSCLIASFIVMHVKTEESDDIVNISVVLERQNSIIIYF